VLASLACTEICKIWNMFHLSATMSLCIHTCVQVHVRACERERARLQTSTGVEREIVKPTEEGEQLGEERDADLFAGLPWVSKGILVQRY